MQNQFTLIPSETREKGFTIIEMLVVISLTVLLMLTATSLFLSTLVGNSKSVAGQLVKNEGDYAVGQMELLLRNAIQLVPNSNGQICETDMNSIAFKSLDGGTTEFFQELDPSDNAIKIASNAGRVADSGSSASYLTSDAITIISPLVFNCRQSDSQDSTYVTIQFQLQKGDPGVDESRDIVRQLFQGSVNLRSL